MKTRPEISDAEIQSMMDFDKVLQLHKSASRPRYLWKIVGSGLVIALIVGWAILNPRREEKIIKEPPIVVPEVKQPVVQPEQKPVQQEKKIVKKPTEVPAKPKQEVSPTTTSEANVYTEAEPIKGYEDLYTYFDKELKYPAEVTRGVQGDVTVTFLINRSGKPEQIKFLNSLGPEFDKEVIRVVNNMLEWKPAMQNGKPVPAKITQSFKFSINK